MKALVTGGAGFVGRRFCEYLLGQGYKVTCVDPIVPRTGGLPPEQWPFFNPIGHDSFTFYKCDCRDFFLEDKSKFDLVVHLAAMVGGRIMIENEPLAIAQDLAIDAIFFDWASKIRPNKILYFSSSASYPVKYQAHGCHVSLTEDMISFASDIGMPDLTYGWAKLTGEYLGRLAHKNYDLDIVSYRPFSGYGEDQDMSYPFPAICSRAINYVALGDYSKPFHVWGSGMQMRDFIHIDDCIQGVASTMNKISDGSAINLSTGIPTSFIDLAEVALEQAGHPGQPLISGTSDKPEGVFARYGSIEWQSALGFTQYTSLKDGVEKTLKFLKNTTTR